MANIEHIDGKTLKIGMFKVSGCIAQNGSVEAGGETKIYKDENGDPCSVYAIDRHRVVSFTGLIEADADEKKIGEKIPATDIEGITLETGEAMYVKSWKVDWKNDDVQQVSGTAEIRAVPQGNS